MALAFLYSIPDALIVNGHFIGDRLLFQSTIPLIEFYSTAEYHGKWAIMCRPSHLPKALRQEVEEPVCIDFRNNAAIRQRFRASPPIDDCPPKCRPVFR